MFSYFFNLIQIFLNENIFLAPFIFIFIHVILSLFFLPCSPMTLISGLLWGPFEGLFISMFAAIMYASVTFMLSRYFLRCKIHDYLYFHYPKIILILNSSVKHDYKFIASMQFIPFFPGSSLGYFFGLSNIIFIRFIFFTFLFILPFQFFIVLSGHSIFSFLFI